MRRMDDMNFVAPARRFSPVAWLILAVGAAAGTLLADLYLAAEETRAGLARQAERLERQLRPTAVAARPMPHKSAPAGRPAQPPAQQAFPWDAILREIERATDRRVALLAIDTEAGAGRTRLDAEARSIDDALDFAERLRASPLVERAFLLAHETRTSPAGPVTGFSLQIEWSPA
jgi:hypothetical protein